MKALRGLKLYALAAIYLTTSIPYVYAEIQGTPAQQTGVYPANSTLPSSNNTLDSIIPPAPNIDVKGFVLMDASSGQILASKNANVPMAPASLTKMMSLYLIATALEQQQISMETLIPISTQAWKTGGSRMFVKAGTQVPVGELLQGIIVDSGNDATMAMAEYLGGSTEGFVALMNDRAKKLGLNNTHYADPTGLPTDNHYSTPQDIATLARSIIRDFPQFYPWFKQKTFSYNKITQSNRNHLLWRDPSVDGMKTGFTDDAGYCLVASALRNGTRLISVVMGAPTQKARYDDSQKLLNYGFRFYKTIHFYHPGEVITHIRAWYGQDKYLPVGVVHNVSLTVPTGSAAAIKSEIDLQKLVEAPINKGQILGHINLALNGKVVTTEPVVALETNPEAGLLTRFWDSIRLTLHRIL